MEAKDEEPQKWEMVISEEDDEHDTKERVLQRYFLQEWQIVKYLLNDIVSNGRISDPSSVPKIRSIMDKYQEQCQLLEPYLESIVSPLMFIIRSKTVELGFNSDEVLHVIKPICIIIYSLITVCGYKAVIKLYPHHVSDLEQAVALLEKCHNTASATSPRHESTGEMEAKCVILFWLSILVLVPFDISSVDTSIAGSGSASEQELAPLVSRILVICRDHLSSAGPMCTMAGSMLSRLLTRPDMLKAFSSFTEWTHEILSSPAADVGSRFRLLGALEALASIFKAGSRDLLLDVVPTVWNDLLALTRSSTAASSSLLQKYMVKLTQQIGLTCLPHCSPSGRYVVASDGGHFMEPLWRSSWTRTVACWMIFCVGTVKGSNINPPTTDENSMMDVLCFLCGLGVLCDPLAVTPLEFKWFAFVTDLLITWNSCLRGDYYGIVNFIGMIIEFVNAVQCSWSYYEKEKEGRRESQLGVDRSEGVLVDVVMEGTESPLGLDSSEGVKEAKAGKLGNHMFEDLNIMLLETVHQQRRSVDEIAQPKPQEQPRPRRRTVSALWGGPEFPSRLRLGTVHQRGRSADEIAQPRAQ